MHQNDLKEKDEFIKFFKIVLGKIASAARNAHQTAATTFAFFSVFVQFFYGSSPKILGLNPLEEGQFVWFFPKKQCTNLPAV